MCEECISLRYERESFDEEVAIEAPSIGLPTAAALSPGLDDPEWWEPQLRRMSRRAVLLGGPAAVGVLLMAPEPAAAASAALLTKMPRIRRRSAWAGTRCPVRGQLYYEKPGNVKVLLEHHSVLPNNSYTAAQVPGIIRSFYKLHIDKGWPDLAYNFMIDRFGGIWEGRANSLRHPTIPSATGGSQGFSQLVCWIGDHRTAAPSTAAQRSMISMLAWLARRYEVRTTPGATTSFVSRGSSRYPRGSTVTTRTIEGHRKMTHTVCPGDAAYAIVRKRSQPEVTRVNAHRISASLSSTSAPFGTTVRLRGTVKPNHAGKRIYLQRYSDGAWRNVTSKLLSSTSAYAFSLRPATRGQHKYRAYKSGGGSEVEVASRTVVLTVT
jgi:hypothetical protein